MANENKKDFNTIINNTKGIEFQIPNKYGTFLMDILQGIDDDSSKWIVSNEEVLEEGAKPFFVKEEYSEKEFKNLISVPNYYLIFLNLSRILPDGTKDLELIIDDNIFVDVYSSKPYLLEKIKTNCEKNGFENLHEVDRY